MPEKIIPNEDFVLLEMVDLQKTAGGIIIPEKARGNQRDAQLAKVTACGTGRTTEYGARITPSQQVGDHVLIARGAGVEVESEGKKYRLLRCSEVLATVEESRIVMINSGLVTP